ncbi:hypothetical protein HO133_003255 [Letharia lupina]|uniref:DUF7896 domain-containing protein n=1 Tax=Letharia lupina TaxID=560253 RepID=A0A8H6CB10_9LECA|nr:uncharacterized protein HO133_003255 [Letharia lupina]KAF6220124.1 hypothetical protein HO133_003255 [Letharia lupina]
MSDPELMSYLEGMKKKFWNERRHLQQDEIKLQWAARAAPYTSILLDTQAPIQPLELTSTQGHQMARQSTSKSWSEAASRRRASEAVTPLELGQCYYNAPSSEPMSRKRARTSQYGPEIAAENAISPPSLDTNPWQLDSNAPYCGYTNTSTSGPSFKARRTSAGRMPINIPEDSPNIRVYEPAEYIQQSRAFTSSSYAANTRSPSSFNNHCIPLSSLELPSPFSVSPTTTVSERFTNTTPPTSAAMSREDSLAASFCGAFGMMRANSGVSEIDSGQQMYRQDSCHGLHLKSLSTDEQGVGTPFDQSLYFAHAEGTAIETSPASMLAVEQLQLHTTLELDTETKRDVSSCSIPTVEQIQSLPTMELHTKMVRDASSDSNISSTSRIFRRSQEQIAQAARPIAPKDVAERPASKQSSLSGSQDMLRQRSAPEAKVLIPKLQYSRQTKEKLRCERCNKNPDGYRGSHELHRHMALDHNSFRTAWVCVDISPDGFLSGCAACESKKPYGQDYNAAAHLRRFHFHPKSEVRRTNVDPEERRGGKGGGKDPPMSECRRWMRKIKVRGKDYMAVADSAVDGAGDDAAEDDEESKEEQGEQDEVGEDLFLHGNVQKNDETLQSHDGAVGQHISAPPLDGANRLELAMTNDRQFTLQAVDIPFSRSGFQSGFETSFGTYFDSNAASLSTPSINLSYSRQTLSSSAPAASSFLASNSAGSTHAHDNFASSTPVSLDMPSAMSTTRSAHTLEDLNAFQDSYIPGNVSYGMPSPNNPHYGLLDFPPFP